MAEDGVYVADDFLSLVTRAQQKELEEFEEKRKRERAEATIIRNQQIAAGEHTGITMSELLAKRADAEAQERDQRAMQSDLERINQESATVAAKEKEAREQEQRQQINSNFPEPPITER